MSVKMVIISDSRGRHLQEYLSTQMIKVLFYSGARLDDLLRLSHVRCQEIYIIQNLYLYLVAFVT